jgi:hypothetical protein
MLYYAIAACQPEGAHLETNNLRNAFLLLPLMLLAVQAQAQLYKSVGPDGKITYSDTPPQANQKLLEKRIVRLGQHSEFSL